MVTETGYGRGARDPLWLMRARDRVLPALADAFAAALLRFDDVLFDRAESAGTSQLIFLDGMRELRRRRDEIVARFGAQLDRAWKGLECGRPLSAEAELAGRQTGGLSLVAEDELESRLAVRNLAGVLLRDCKPVLLRIDRRLGAIAGGLELDADRNPIGPEHIGVAIHEAFALCEFAAEVRLMLIKLCERGLCLEIARLYQALDQQLAQAGVVPEMAPAAADRLNGQTRNPAFGGAGAEGPDAGNDDEQIPAWANRFVNQWAERRGLVQPGGQDAGSAGSASGAMPTGADTQRVLLEALQELLQQSRDARRQVPAAVAAPDILRQLSQREMLSVLSLLQATPSAGLRSAINDSGESLSQRLKSEVLRGATQLGVDPANARLDPIDEDAIDLVGMLFDVMLDERDLATHPREVIGRLLVPFVKVALLDRRMFVQKTHPARRLLNALAEACEGNQGDSAVERALMTKVEEVVDRLTTEFNENLAIFLTLEEEFRDFLGQHRRRIEIAERRAAESQRGQERLDMARMRAAAEVASRVDARDMPQALQDFLRQPWAHHLTMIALRESNGGEAFGSALALADGMLDELQQARSHVAGKPWLHTWQPALQQVFTSAGLHPDMAAKAIEVLHDSLQAVAEARPESECPLPGLPPMESPQPVAKPDLELVGGTDTLDFDNADADRFRGLPIGTWLDFIDKDGRVQAGKLSWISPISARLLFVSRRGVRFCVASPEELAVMVRLGRLRSHVEDGAFDSAMNGVIRRLDTGAMAVA